MGRLDGTQSCHPHGCGLPIRQYPADCVCVLTRRVCMRTSTHAHRCGIALQCMREMHACTCVHVCVQMYVMERAAEGSVSSHSEL